MVQLARTGDPKWYSGAVPNWIGSDTHKVLIGSMEKSVQASAFALDLS